MNLLFKTSIIFLLFWSVNANLFSKERNIISNSFRNVSIDFRTFKQVDNLFLINDLENKKSIFPKSENVELIDFTINESNLNLHMNSPIQLKVSIEIVNIFGVVDFRELKTISTGDENLNLDVSNLRNGFYLLCLRLSNKIITKHFIINN